jgi:predicted naringenin-chalcone synthase
MSAYIHQISTSTPGYTYAQSYTRDRLKGWAKDPKTKRLIHAIYNRSGIETRHSVTGDFDLGTEATLYRSEADGTLIPPGTAERNRIYTHCAREIAVELARRTIQNATGFSKEDITHIIYTSCTGFANPGPDFHIIKEMGLRPNVERYTLGFMGCYAAFPALRMAAQFCEANADAVVLVMCLELCTLHMQINDQPDSILANSLFADGASAAIVSARTPLTAKPAYRLDGFESAVLPSSEADMAWEIGDEGFNIVLSSYVPEIIGGNIRQLLHRVLNSHGTKVDEIDEWAVHPGGRAILDKVQDSLHLKPDALEAARNVLRDYGNMSSATILFVLKEMLDSAETEDAALCAMAFGPGLTVETAMMQRLGCTAMSVPAVSSAARA